MTHAFEAIRQCRDERMKREPFMKLDKSIVAEVGTGENVEQRGDEGTEVLGQTLSDSSEVGAGAARRVWAEEAVEVGRLGPHRSKEQFVLRPEALVEDGLRDARGASHVARRGRVTTFAEDLSGAT